VDTQQPNTTHARYILGVHTPKTNKRHTRYNISAQSIYWHVEDTDVMFISKY